MASSAEHHQPAEPGIDGRDDVALLTELDRELTFEDLGVSAFYGRNVEVGELGAFLLAVEDGRVPHGSYLLVESLDRVSRQTARKAANVLGDIVDAGIVVIDMEDGAREHSKDILDTDPFAFVMVVLRFVRAHQESVLKGARVRKAYDNKREKAREASEPGRDWRVHAASPGDGEQQEDA